MFPPLTRVTVEVEGALGRLVLNRPERRNALDRVALEEIVRAAESFDAIDSVRVIVVSGRGRAFCAGADLGAFASLLGGAGPSEAELREAAALGQRMVDAVAALRAVTVARVHGCAIGGGFLLATACDFRVAAANAFFAIPEVDIGIPLAWGGVPRLVRELGPSVTRDLIMTCRRCTPDELASHGFVHRVVDPSALDEETTALARELLEKPPRALGATKRQIEAAVRETLSSAASDPDLLASSMADPAFPEAAMRYLERLRG